MSWSNTIGQVVNGYTKIYQPLAFPDGSVQSTAVARYGGTWDPVTTPFNTGGVDYIPIETTLAGEGVYLISFNLLIKNTSGSSKSLTDFRFFIKQGGSGASVTTTQRPFLLPLTLNDGQEINYQFCFVIINYSVATTGFYFETVYTPSATDPNFAYVLDDLVAFRLSQL